MNTKELELAWRTAQNKANIAKGTYRRFERYFGPSHNLTWERFFVYMDLAHQAHEAWKVQFDARLVRLGNR